ncbi:Photosystem I chlorophyll a apoprotein A1 [Capsicum chinense]|nr:Photosystem I chlorophyll a apoprotein A1 [Capsicum chinense]
MYSMPPYPYLAIDYGTQLPLFIFHMWIGRFLIVGAAAHVTIFMVRYYDPTTLYKDLLDCVIRHHDATISHLNWACIFLGFHSFGLYIHNDTMSALGHPQNMFSDTAIQLQPIFAQCIQNTHDLAPGALAPGATASTILTWEGGDLVAVDGKMALLPILLGIANFLVYHIHTFTIHVTVLILLKGVLFACSSHLLPDKSSITINRWPHDFLWAQASQPLKWKVLGLHTLEVGYTPIIEKELSSPLGRVGLSPNPSLWKNGGISATIDSPCCSPLPPDAAEPYRDLFPLFSTRLVEITCRVGKTDACSRIKISLLGELDMELTNNERMVTVASVGLLYPITPTPKVIAQRIQINMPQKGKENSPAIDLMLFHLSPRPSKVVEEPPRFHSFDLSTSSKPSSWRKWKETSCKPKTLTGVGRHASDKGSILRIKPNQIYGKKTIYPVNL